MERRMTERMEGAAAALGSTARGAVATSLLVAFDAAVRFGVARILSTRTRPGGRRHLAGHRPVAPTRRCRGCPGTGGAWRGALAAVAEGVSAGSARDGRVGPWVRSSPRGSGGYHRIRAIDTRPRGQSGSSLRGEGARRPIRADQCGRRRLVPARDQPVDNTHLMVTADDELGPRAAGM